MKLRPEGAMGEMSQTIQVATLGMNRRWYRLSLTSPLLGNSIATASIRPLTGATIVAIQVTISMKVNVIMNWRLLSA